ncbi:NUDIX domain-containing protein [Streptomyces sp. NPDC050842]|uniref:NUDIX hydrolase n=1 Tax=Streptomyces sp. NPDC050842 TaxID=3365636 RepID=UPI0037BAFDCB
MPPSPVDIRALLTAYLDRHPAERGALAGLLAALDAPGAPTSRTTLPGHITCSVAVINRDRRVLHVLHRGTGLLLLPGGHVEAADETLLAAALREVAEAAGIPAAALALTPEFRDGPIDIDAHDIGARPARGEPAHQHYDFRFVLHVADDAPDVTLQAEEVDDAAWLPFDEVSSPTLRAKLIASGLTGVVRPVSASAVIHDGHGRYLLHLRDANEPIWAPGTWDLLGGGREPQDSTLRDTVIREVREEAGLDLADLTSYAVDHVIGTDGTRVSIKLFTGLWRGDPSALSLAEGVMVAWVRPEKFPFLTMVPSTRKLLERHAAEHPAPAAGAGAAVGTRAPATSPPGTVPNIIGVHLYLERDGKVLLGRRHPDSAYAGGAWHALAGHLEAESATAGLVREAFEEAGLVIDPADLDLVHTVHLVDRPGGRPRIGFFFRPRQWEGVPQVREPEKCVGWQWHGVKDLPEPIVAYTRAAIEGIQAGRVYTELGWAR